LNVSARRHVTPHGHRCIATDTRSAADTFVHEFLRWLSGLQIVAGGRQVRFVDYLSLPSTAREGDERPVVDQRFTRELLGLLGYRDHELIYDHAHRDFKVVAANGGPVVDCFVVEDKNSTIDRLVDHLPQLTRYARESRVRLGVLCNGRRILVYWYGESFDIPSLIVSINVERLAAAIRGTGQQELPLEELTREDELALKSLYIRLALENFADLEAHLARISLPEDQWTNVARNVSDAHHEREFIDRLTQLIMDVEADAEHQLRLLHAAYADYLLERVTLQLIPRPGAVPEQIRNVPEELTRVRGAITDRIRDAAARRAAPNIAGVHELLVRFEQEPSGVPSATRLLDAIMGLLPGMRRPPAIAELVRRYYAIVLGATRRRAELTLHYDRAIDAVEKLRGWQQILHGTFLFEDEDSALREFSLQTAYVYIIRALLVRICEDKRLFSRGLSDDGFGQLRSTLERFTRFTQRFRYHEMLNIVYRNAEDLYAHFYGGRRLFDWYEMDEARFVRVLYDLNLYNFSTVDRDIIGTVYEKYADAHERKEKGRYFTPPAVVSYILDTVEYTPEAPIAGTRLLDPACGSGTFLVQAVQRLIEVYRRSPVPMRAGEILERVTNAVYGFDINPFACYLAETNLLIQVLDLVRDAIADQSYRPIERFHIYNTDSLALPANGGQLPLGLDAEEMAREQRVIEAIKARHALDETLDFRDGFDVVVGNPPYGLADGLGGFTAADGNGNLLAAFMELAGRLARVGGRVGMIVQSSWLGGGEYASTRGYVFRVGALDVVVKLPYDVFQDAYVDTAVFTLTKTTEFDPAGPFVAGTARTFEFPARGGLAALDHATLAYVRRALKAWHRQPNLEIILNPVALELRDHVRGLHAVPLERVADSARGVLLGPVQPAAARRTWRDLPFFVGDVRRNAIDIRTEVVRYDRQLPERPATLRLFKGPRALVRRLISRQYRAMAAVAREPFVNTKDLYMLHPTAPEVTPEYLAGLINSQLGAIWLVGASTIAQKDDYPQLTLEDLRRLPVVIPDAASVTAIGELVAHAQELHAALAGLRTRGHHIELLDGVREMGEVTVVVAPSAVMPPGPQESVSDAVTNGRVQLIGRLDGPLRRADVFQRDGAWCVLLRGTPDRPQTALVARDSVTANVVARAIDEERGRTPRGVLPIADALARVRIPRSAGAVQAWQDQMQAEEDRVRGIVRELWHTDDRVDAVIFDLYRVPPALVAAVKQLFR